MPGVKGSGGPVPKRSNQRRRRNKPAKATKKAKTSAKAPDPWAADKDWHPIATRWFESLKASGQRQFYEESDWALAYTLAESMSRDLKPQVVGIVEETGEVIRAVIPLKGASLSAYLKGMTTLLVTEGDRRRAGIELERGGAPEPEPDDEVAQLDAYRSRRAG